MFPIRLGNNNTDDNTMVPDLHVLRHGLVLVLRQTAKDWKIIFNDLFDSFITVRDEYNNVLQVDINLYLKTIHY